ncbi:MAG: universal stress protein [Bacteroidales bacterium]
MKILVCTDGSEYSQKALEKAAIIAGGCSVYDLAVIHVYEDKFDFSFSAYGEETSITEKEMERFRELSESHKEKEKKILSDALKFFEEKNIQARGILMEGHPAEAIVSVGCGEGFDMIIIGSRGRGGLKKVFLGSVSSAVVQEAESCSVLTVR